MSLVIRLTSTGKRGERRFRVVVKEKRSKRDGKALENLGWFEKTASGTKQEIKKDRIDYWIKSGAKMSPTVKEIVSAYK